MAVGARPSVVIENPILNSPYDVPTRHFRFDDHGITDEIVDGRRPSSYFVPIPAAKKRGGQRSGAAKIISVGGRRPPAGKRCTTGPVSSDQTNVRP
jgi:hypothetical protein